VVLVLTVCLLVVGCQGDGKVEVSGAVTVDGAPIESGFVRFVQEDNPNDTEVGTLVNGQYHLRTTPGRKRVEVVSRREVPGSRQPTPLDEPVMEEYLPEKYHRKSELRADVAPRGPNAFDFALTALPPGGRRK
jgi:hypothetical protein